MTKQLASTIDIDAGPEAGVAGAQRRLADAIGIRAPSLYKHLTHKTAVETAIIIDGFEQAAIAFEAATRDAAEPLAAFVAACRAFAAFQATTVRGRC
jgi:hypothetical protein